MIFKIVVSLLVLFLIVCGLSAFFVARPVIREIEKYEDMKGISK